MALKIFDKFAPRANPADSNYPYGSIKNESVPGAKDGTPLDAAWGNDMVGFTDALLTDAGITPSGAADTAIASQRLDAVKKVSSLQAAIQLIEQWGYTYKGTFAKGFTYSQVGDAGVDSDFNVWIYVGAGAPNKVVTAGTVPSIGAGYEQVTFNQASNVIYSENSNVESALMARPARYTLLEAQSSDLKDGQLLVLNDFCDALYETVADYDTGGYYLDYKEGSKFKLIHKSRKVLAKNFDLSSTDKIAGMIKYSSKQMLSVDWAGVGSLDVDYALYLEASAPTKLIWKCSDGKMTFNYTGVNAIGNLIRMNNTVSAQVSGITFNCNNLVANPLHIRKESSFSGSVVILDYEAHDVRQVDPITTGAAGLLVSGSYKAVSYLNVLVDGVHHETQGRSSVGAAIINFSGLATVNKLNVSNITTGSGVDADGLSVFGPDVGTLTTRLGARLELTNSTFKDCLGRFVKLQVSDWEVHGCTFTLTNGVTTIDEWRGLDAQAGGGHFHDCKYIIGTGITWGASSTLWTMQAIRNDGNHDSSHIHDISVSMGTSGLDRLMTYLVQYGENTLDVHNIKVNGQTVDKGLLFGLKGKLSDTDKINIHIRDTSVPDYAAQDFFRQGVGADVDFGDKLYLEFISNSVQNKSSVVRLYNLSANFSVGSNFLIANNAYINDRIEWVFDLDKLSDGNTFYAGGQIIEGAPEGRYTHYMAQASVQRAVSTTGTSESRRTTGNGGTTWNSWVSI